MQSVTVQLKKRTYLLLTNKKIEEHLSMQGLGSKTFHQLLLRIIIND
jgi:hypothetical protein